MNDDLQNAETATQSEIVRISRAIRCFFGAIVLGLSYPNIHCALKIGHFQNVYSDFLGSQPLPVSTVFMLNHQAVFVALSVIIPVAAIATVFLRDQARSIYIAAFLIFSVFAQLFFQWFTLTGPLFEIIRMMGEPAQ